MSRGYPFRRGSCGYLFKIGHSKRESATRYGVQNAAVLAGAHRYAELPADRSEPLEGIPNDVDVLRGRPEHEVFERGPAQSRFVAGIVGDLQGDSALQSGDVRSERYPQRATQEVAHQAAALRRPDCGWYAITRSPADVQGCEREG